MNNGKPNPIGVFGNSRVNKARVLVTNTCNRDCFECCNKDPQHVPRPVSFDELLTYDEINITGGDPALFPTELMRFVYALFSAGFHPGLSRTMNLYTSSVMDEMVYHSLYITGPLRGLHHTLHDDATDDDIKDLRRLSKTLLTVKSAMPYKSFRLAIDARLYMRYDFSNIDFSAWDVVRKLVWKHNCPLPVDETLLSFDMVEWAKSKVISEVQNERKH